MNSDGVYLFMFGVLVGLYLSDLLGAMEYRTMVRDIPEFLKDEKEK